MAVNTTWTNPTSSPPDLVTGQTLTQTAWEEVLSNLNFLGGSDGNTPTSRAMYYQNAADQGHKLQRVISATLTCDIATGSFFKKTASLSWPATFANSPNVNCTAGYIGGTGQAAETNAPSTTTVTAYLWSGTTGDQGTVEVWGIG